jgi:uncharacterized protein (TIGR00369 family)
MGLANDVDPAAASPEREGLARSRRIPFLDHLGVEVVAFGQGRASLSLTLVPGHLNSMAVAHGGVVMTLLDAAMAIAGRAAHTDNYDDPINCLTVEMKTTFIAPGRGSLLVHGTCVHKGRSLMFCEGEARDASGQLVARSSGTFKALTSRDSGADA